MKTFELKVGGRDFKVDIDKFNGKQAVVKVNGKSYEVDVKKAAGAIAPKQTAPPPPGSVPEAPPSDPAPIASLATSGQVLAPMPGLILDIMVSVGDSVTAGLPVIKMEAMKMENEIPATANGTVKEICVKKGDSVSTDQVMLVMDEG